jgi:YbbR domain-containing protein
MKTWQQVVFHNWHLKLFSLVLATGLWAAVASEPTSEIPVSVPLEYQNIPGQTEVIGDVTSRVEIRLRGPSSLLREMSPQDVSISLDIGSLSMGQEKILPLTARDVKAPFGIEVVRVIPARVRLTIERTTSRTLRVAPMWSGALREGYEIESVTATPATVDVQGPASHVRAMENVPTTSVDVTGKRATFTETVDLDVLDPIVRVPKTSTVQVEVKIRRER